MCCDARYSRTRANECFAAAVWMAIRDADDERQQDAEADPGNADEACGGSARCGVGDPGGGAEAGAGDGPV